MLKAAAFDDIKRAVQIQKIFLKYLGRNPDDEAWEHYYASREPIDTIRSIVLQSDEFKTKQAVEEADSLWSPATVAPWIISASTPHLGWEPIVINQGIDSILDLSMSSDPVRTTSFRSFLAIPMAKFSEPDDWAIDLAFSFIHTTHTRGSKVLVCSDMGLTRAPVMACLYLACTTNRPFVDVFLEAKNTYSTFAWDKRFMSEETTARLITKYKEGF